MDIVDAQLHAWQAESERYPWDPEYTDRLSPTELGHHRGEHVRTADQLVWMMDAVGIDAALLTSPRIYGWDHSYAFDSARRHPGRFGVVGPLGPDAPDVEERVRHYREQPWGVGVRVLLWPDSPDPLGEGGFRRVFSCAERAEVPIFLGQQGMLDEVAAIAREFPNLRIVLDHLGLSLSGADIDDRLRMVPALLALARFDNVAVKATAMPQLSRQRYPFDDLWPLIHQVLGAFGAERVMWGTDITRAENDLTYCEALEFVQRSHELSESEKAQVLGGTARALLRWPSSPTGAAPPDPTT